MSNKSKLLILIADDNEVDREMLKRYTLGLRAEVKEAHDCKSCLQILKEVDFDCLILDYYLGDCTGYELITTIRDNGIDSGIIVITGVDDDLLASKVIKLGADDYIPKSRLNADIVAVSILTAIKSRKIKKILKSCIQQLNDVACLVNRRLEDREEITDERKINE